MAETEQTVKSEAQGETAGQGSPAKSAQTAEFSEAADAGRTGQASSVEILLDITLPVTVSLGRTKIPVRRLLQLGSGSVLQLDKSIDSPVDLFVRDTRFATGDVVVVDGQFGVRIKEICGVVPSAGSGPEHPDGEK
jgi:flagellar motor switch protein FliN/FliY